MWIDSNRKLMVGTEEAARMLNVSRPTLYRFIKRSRNPLPAILLGGRKYLIPRDALNEWMREEVAT